ncbi:hypothetical protein [Lentibacter sp.]|uniref:hypothetical protein n=1 Tax=Lentibacter sp. TaxID=2024994 RepID=UPI003F6CCC0E
MNTDALLELIKARASGCARYLVAIAGAPASGKTTLAAELASKLGPSASVLPMDGFHLDNSILRERGLLARKGAPETFDALGFVELLERVRRTPVVGYPTFDRQADCARADGGQVSASTRIVLVEGNYLLLRTAPWAALEGLFDLTVSLEVARDELERRLIARWLKYGLPPEAARARALDNDMKNADFVAAHARAADIVLGPLG